jgi:hypothetical protein
MGMTYLVSESIAGRIIGSCAYSRPGFVKRCRRFLDLSAALGLMHAKAGPHPIYKPGICQARMAVIEEWAVIFNGELYGASGFLASNLRNKPQPKVDAGRYATAGNYLAVYHNAFVNRNRSEGLEEFHCHPVRYRAMPFEESRGAENECSGANGSHVSRRFGLFAEKIQCLGIGQQGSYLQATRRTDEIELRAISKRNGWRYCEATVRPYGIARFPNQEQLRSPYLRKDFVRPS